MTEFDLVQAGFINDGSGSWRNTYTTEMGRPPYLQIKMAYGKGSHYWTCEVMDIVTGRWVSFNFEMDETLSSQFAYIQEILGWDIKFPTCGGLMEYLHIPQWLKPLISKIQVTHTTTGNIAQYVLWLGNMDVIRVFYIECAPDDGLFQDAKIFEIGTRAKEGHHLVLATGGNAINAFLKEIVKEAEA